MSIKGTDRWRSPSRGTPEQAIATFTVWGSFPIGQVSAAVREIYRLCDLVGLDAALLVSHAAVETGSQNAGRGFLSEAWATQNRETSTTNRYNIAGIGITDGGDLGYGFSGGLQAARAFVVHHARYEILVNDPAWSHLEPYLTLDPRYADVPIANRGTVVTVEAMTGKWWTNATGDVALVSRGNAIFPGISDQGASTPDPSQPTGATTVTYDKKDVYLLVTAGHRSDTDYGDPTEKERTQYLARDYVDAFRKAGFASDWWQRDLDGDSQPTMTTGGLDTVALGVGRVILDKIKTFKLVILLDCHYNGPHSPVHVIVPDTTGLGTAYAGGAPSDDTAAVNLLDMTVAQHIAAEIVAATGMSIYRGRLGVPGIMSERDTGVGIKYEARLAMFAATASSRAKAVRLVVEHGGYSDTAATKNTFSSVCAAAAVKAVTEALAIGTVSEPTKPADPTPQYVSKIARPWSVPLIAGTKPFATASDGTMWFATRQTYRTLEAVDRDQKATSNSPDLAEQVAANTVFASAAIGTNKAGKPWVLTQWGSMIDMTKLAPVLDTDVAA